ncbi:hypothetical protein SI65_03804 [Aspergillus cristatus]|uniref:Uncharacterized protein n=1 Tax=Aspergillus cristatus TaxID=573508 RepID=A0A1E3BIY1_ASPCR|nr:hypothetical protein SI65_03804 [Aspergillus cristatus]
MLSYLPVKIEDFLARLEQVEARELVERWTQTDRDPRSKTPWAASTLSQGYKNERGSRPILSQSFDLTSYNVIVPPREAPASQPLGGLARKRPAEDIESGNNKRAKAGGVPAERTVFLKSLLLAN